MPLPRLMLVTQRARMKPDFFSALEAALLGGARLVQLREKDLPGDELMELASRAKSLCEKFGATLIINGAPEVARELGLGLHLAEGAGGFGLGVSVHSVAAARRAAGDWKEAQAPLGADQLQTPQGLRPLPIQNVSTPGISTNSEIGSWGSASVPTIGEADLELSLRDNAGTEACPHDSSSPAYLIFGSVFPTQSHPGAAPAGLEKLREVCAAVEIPVFAIGGVTAQNADQCLAAGAHGVAVIGAVWDAPDVAVAVREIIETTDGRG